jgi:hypothetical protein
MNCQDVDQVGILDFASTFEGRSAIDIAEMSNFLEKRALYYLRKRDLAAMEALYYTANEIDLAENTEAWMYLSLFIRTAQLMKYLSEKACEVV